MKKYYIFSETNGSYSYTIFIIQGNSIEECITKEPDLKAWKIKDYNYNPKDDIDLFTYNMYNKERPFIKEYYNQLALDADDRSKQKGISMNTYLTTETRGWLDYIELYGDLPNNYLFTDGHDG